MPPPLPIESDAESVTEEIPHSKEDPSTQAKEELKDAAMKDENNEQDEEEDDENTFVVEAVMDHRSDFEDGQMRYHVKWKGYEKKADRTWETEDNLEGAKEVLEAYWEKIGGKPETATKPTKKRGRQSTGATKPDTSKRPKMSKSGRRSNGALPQDFDPSHIVGYTDVGDDDWKPPHPKDGAWDNLVQSVDTVVKENSDGELWGYLIWNDKNDDGRFYRSKAKLPTIYRACPQRMLHFYEKHLVFSQGETTADEAIDDKTVA